MPVIASARPLPARSAIFAKSVGASSSSITRTDLFSKTALNALGAERPCTFICGMEKAFVSGVQVIQIAGVFLKQGKNGLM
jgi:hypothetical protein